MLLEVIVHGLAYSLLYGTIHLLVAKLGLCLSLKLRLSHFDRDDSGQSLAEVVRSNLNLRLIHLLAQLIVLVSILLQRTGKSDTETSKVSTTLDGVDIINVRVDILRIVVIVEQSYLNRNACLLSLQAYRVTNNRSTVAVNVAHKLLQSLLSVEHLRLAQITLLVRTQIGQRDSNTCIKECEFAHTTSHDVILIHSLSEDSSIRPELLTSTALVGLAHYLYRVERLTHLIFLLVDLTVAEHLGEHVRRKSVNTAHTHTVQTT